MPRWTLARQGRIKGSPGALLERTTLHSCSIVIITSGSLLQLGAPLWGYSQAFSSQVCLSCWKHGTMSTLSGKRAMAAQEHQPHSNTKSLFHSHWCLHDLLLTELICREDSSHSHSKDWLSFRHWEVCGLFVHPFSLPHTVTFIFTVTLAKINALRTQLLETLVRDTRIQLKVPHTHPPFAVSVTPIRGWKWQHFQGQTRKK